MRHRLLVVLGIAQLAVPLAAQVAQVRHAPSLNGTVEGSVHVMTAESMTLNGSATVTGDLLVPGTPTVQLNGNPAYGGTLDGPGAVSPTNHKVTLNGSAALGHVIRRTDAVTLPTVAAPPPPPGSVALNINSVGQTIDWTNVRDLTLSGGAGSYAVPPGSYGDFTATAGNSFVLGIVGSNQPAVYSFQHLTLNATSHLDIVGPVIVTLANEVSTSGNLGSSTNPAWLKLNMASGGLTLNGNASAYGYVTAPSGPVTLNGSAQLVGGLVADQLTINGHGLLRLLAPPPSVIDVDHDGMDDAWERAHGLNPLIDDSNLDNDHDGISNLVEFQQNLDPSNPDSDGDGLYDGDEIALGLNPIAPNPDIQPPTIPTNLTAGAVTTGSVTFSWQPATDDLKVSGYLVYRDGQPIDTDQPIRGTSFTDTNLPDGEEFTYQVRSFDFAGNLSPLGVAILVTTVAADADQDGLPDEWENKYFDGEPAVPDDDADGDGMTNLQEFQAGTDPKNFYNGINPVTEALNGAAEGPNGEVALMIRRPDGTPWANAPYNFDSSATRRKLSAWPTGPFERYQLRVRAGADGMVRCYLEPLAP